MFDRVVSLTQDLRGMQVLRYDSEEPLGEVQDVVVHPTEGGVIALLIRTVDGAERVIPSSDWSIRGESVLARPYSTAGGPRLRATLARGVLASERLLGMEVVTDAGNCLGYITDRGKYLGYIRDVFIVPGEKRVVYRVGNSPVQYGSFFMDGSIPCAYSRAKERVEVPRRTEAKFAAPSPGEAISLAEP